MWISYSREKYQICLIFIPTTTDPNILKQTAQDSESDVKKSLIRSFSLVAEQRHKGYEREIEP